MVQLGWKAPPEQYPPVEMLDYAVAAEQAGFDTLEASDHFQPWSEAGQASFVWTWLGATAVKTSTIHIGTGLTCPILRYHPAIIAQAAATLACFAPNRVFLCVGTGESLNEYAATGDWPPYNERRDMLEEAIGLMRDLWTGKEVTHDGIYYETRKAKIWTLPSERIPIYVSSLVPESAAFAGKHGDGLITTGGQQPEHYKELLKNFASGARESGKDASSMPKLIELNVAYGDDIDGAIGNMQKYWAGSLVPALFSQMIYTPKMSAKNGAVVGRDTIQKMGCFSSNADDHVNYARQYMDLGFTHLYFHCPGPDQKAFLEGYGKDVLPRLRAK